MIKAIFITGGLVLALIFLCSILHFNIHNWCPDTEGAQEHLRLAESFAGDDNDTAAALEYGKAADLAPKDPKIHYQFGNALERVGRMAEARNEFSTALRLNPADKQMKYRFAYFLDRNDEIESAVKEYEDIWQTTPANLELWKNSVFFAAKAYERADRYDKARDLYMTYLKQDRTLNSAWTGLARCLDACKNRKAAIATLRNGIKQIPDDPILHHRLGELLAADNQKGAAIKELRQTIELCPSA